jgi:WD40 repeat protein/tRNA A-37 threonylcarbamoyl transferase component Bud32
MYHSMSRYRVLERLGSGGEGQVWKAEDLRLKRTVAIKFLPPNLVRDEEARTRLQREAQMAAALTHPNIATVYELDEAGDQPYIVMECVEGETLKSRVARGPLELAAVIDIAIQVSGALSAAHARGLLHCDIKSSNIMITPDGLVKVLDFGLAKVASVTMPIASHDGFETSVGSGDLSGHEWVESTSVVSGTLGRMSPEQVRGEALDSRSDIFSLGAVLYEMLTARSPFDGHTRVEILQSVLNDEASPLSAFRDDVPLELEGVVRRALAKRRDERYASVENLVSDLRGLRDELENKTALAARFVIDQGSKNPLDDSASIDLDRFSSLRAVALRQRGWLLLAGALAASLAVWDVIALKPQGSERAIAAVLIAIAAACALGYVAVRPKASRTQDTMPTGAGFRGLLPFQEADRDRFYGRETDTASLLEMIRHSDFRFGVLFGESGCGKTSLLKAGLLPKLWEDGYVPVYCRSYKDPLGAALDECRKLSHVIAVEGEPPTQYLWRVAREMCATLVIICDQFEEFFVSHRSAQEREPFLSFIAASHDNADLPVKFLVSMRSDFLYLISSELARRVEEPLISSRTYHLRSFDEAQAIQIIEKSAGRAGLPFERGLSRQVARDLSSGDVISPSEMQIVGAQLQSKRIYTLQAYRRAGGKEPLVHTFVEDVIQASGDAEGARLLLRSLISDENTRVTWPLEQIARRTQRSTATVERLLRVFVKSRLIREIQEETPWRYELMHEYLIEKINQITGRVMDATQRANRLFRQYLSNYAVDKHTHIPIGRLWFVRRYSDLERGDRERELLKRSLRSGLLRSGAVFLALIVVATLAAAALSVNEVWEGVRLNGGHTAAARKIAISPDGKLLVSVGEDGKVIVWDFARRERLATFTDHTAWVISVAFSADGKWFATASDDQTVIVWDAIKMEKSATLTAHRSPVRAVAFSPNSRWLASASKGPDFRTIVWEVGRWERIGEWPRGADWENVMFSTDCRNLIYAQGDQWDVTTGRRLTGFLDSQGAGTHAALFTDGARLMSIDAGGYVLFFDTIRRGLMSRYRAHRFHGRATALSPDNKLGASGADDIVLWDAATQTKLARLICSTEVWGLTFSPDGKWLVSSHEDGSIVLWNVAERAPVANFNEHNAAVRAVAFSPDGRRLASASEDRSIIVWDAASGRKEAALIGHDTRVAALAFSPDGKQVASCDQDGVHILWDIGNSHPLWTFDGYYFNDTYQKNVRMPAYCLTFSPDGRFIATGGGVIDAAEGQWIVDRDDIMRAFQKRGVIGFGNIYGIAFSPDGGRLVCATPDTQFVYMLDTTSWQVIEILTLSDALPSSLCFSADGRFLVVGETGGAVLLFEANPLRQVAELGRHAARVKSVAFSPDGGQVASSSDDQTIALWDVRRRNMITRIGTHTAPVLSVAFSPDGKQLASGEQDKSVRVYTRRRTLWGYRLD